MDKRIAFVGAGNMASSIIGGLIKSGRSPALIQASARSKKTVESIRERFGIDTSTDNRQTVQSADIVLLAVKPQGIKAVLQELAPALQKNRPLIVSVAAGITLDSLAAWSGTPTLPIVRSMPNTPSLIGLGATGLCANEQVTTERRTEAEALFKAVGCAIWVEDESLIDAVIAVSGSGPAYFFLFMEHMINIGQQLGLDQETSRQLTLQTALGAANMAVQDSVDAGELRKRVTSPGGTTEQAIRAFQQGGLGELVRQAMEAAVERATDMAKEHSD